MNNAHHTTQDTPAGVPEAHPAAKGALGVAAGAAAGAATGAIAGPLGIAVGAIVGGAIGGIAGSTLAKDDDEKAAHDAQLDREIGVTAGHLGEARPDQPPAQRGLYHASSLGVSSPGVESSDGAIQNVDASDE
jgi:hypothetical protein